MRISYSKMWLRSVLGWKDADWTDEFARYIESWGIAVPDCVQGDSVKLVMQRWLPRSIAMGEGKY